MAMLCPHCNLPMCEEEARAGVCPVCTGPLPGRNPPAPAAPPSVEPPASSRKLLWSAGGAVAVCLLVAGIVAFNQKPDDPDQDESDTIRVAERLPSSPREAPRTDDRKTPAPGLAPAKTPEKEPKPPDRKEEKKPARILPPNPEPIPPRLPGQRFVCLPLLDNDTITIDGDLADWKNIPPVELKAIERGRSPKKVVASPRTQKAYLAYCPKGILIGVDAVDTSGQLENAGRPAKGTWSFWNNDAVEVFIDTLNARQKNRGKPSLHQFFAFPFGTATDPGAGGYESLILAGKGRNQEWTIVPHPGAGDNAMLRAGRKTPAGWSMEFLIPRSALRDADLRAGATFGFEVQIDSGTNLFYFWACDNRLVRASMRPDLWGEVLLGGADAKIELLDAQQKPATSFVPGRPMTLRVTDRDINLDPAKKEKVSVTLRSRTGDVQTLALEETAPASGVFAGVLATRPIAGAGQALEVADGEDVVVEYVDRLRASGERNRTLRTTFRASAAGMR